MTLVCDFTLGRQLQETLTRRHRDTDSLLRSSARMERTGAAAGKAPRAQRRCAGAAA